MFSNINFDNTRSSNTNQFAHINFSNTRSSKTNQFAHINFSAPSENMARKNNIINLKAFLFVLLLAILVMLLRNNPGEQIVNGQEALNNQNTIGTIELDFEQVQGLVTKFENCDRNTTCDIDNTDFQVVQKKIYSWLYPQNIPIKYTSVNSAMASVALALFKNPNWMDSLNKEAVFKIFKYYIFEKDVSLDEFGLIKDPKLIKQITSDPQVQFTVNVCAKRDTDKTPTCNVQTFSLKNLNEYFVSQGIFFIYNPTFNVSSVQDQFLDVSFNNPELLFNVQNDDITNVYKTVSKKGENIKTNTDIFDNNLKKNTSLIDFNIALQIHTNTLNPIQIFWGVTLKNGNKSILKNVKNYLEIEKYHLIVYKYDSKSKTQTCNVYSADDITDLTNLNLTLEEQINKGTKNVAVAPKAQLIYLNYKYSVLTQTIDINQEIVLTNNNDKVTTSTFKNEDIQSSGWKNYIQDAENPGKKDGETIKLNMENVRDFNTDDKMLPHPFSNVYEHTRSIELLTLEHIKNLTPVMN